MRWMIALLMLTGIGMLPSMHAADAPAITVSQAPFGKLPDGHEVTLYTLKSPTMVVKIMDYGALVTELHTPDSKGKLGDVVLGFDNLEGYLKGHPYFGATIGRVANRVGNATFQLNGKTYKLAANNGKHSLHGGEKGFDKVLWKGTMSQANGNASVKFTYLSKDGEEGYPGNLQVAVTYTLTAKNELQIDYVATTDQDTPVNLTHHSYFNLAGHASGNVLKQAIRIDADQYTPGDETLVPTGKLAPVKETPLDLTSATPIGKNIGQLTGEPGGYDHNYVLRRTDKKLAEVAEVTDPESGRVLKVLTTEPGLQFYTGNFLDGTVKGKGGAVYAKHQAFCLEPQHYPDSINQPTFPSIVLKPGKTYEQTTVYAFSAK
ncbi:aldose epimerase family protein [Tuwongella immobilis]|uniref:Aldose 1-epimerase n=1 Tax=Tuwongella immobilis TaxID=692036 RepID=A0A6C2YQH8_9BACT|nr:aldose epimerase family protein [Tuwongella immobilis]VIP03363.1 aldose 1-epimerase : Aldose 1-epimerase OS=Sorangium cellulosum So0157-2 GN=SCE1572_08105 PE=3 SV=1: Aldose_epim [Tuwongella immobilis]VTS04098.1 aldose 1-epimerase : Aldose 1-epimerase OS=Sorangium cellulosum So0157-2 GN=SCE1572_08105 PE=3 SV=1: Aldose_epim [Tuwongella immobilis]